MNPAPLLTDNEFKTLVLFPSDLLRALTVKLAEDIFTRFLNCFKM